MTQNVTNAQGSYEITGWDEKTWEGKAWNEQPGAKQTHAVVSAKFQGDLEGEAKIQFLMSYRDDGFCNFVGLQHLSGRIGNRTGSFVMEVHGTFENGAANSTWQIIAGSGTGELKGLRGTGKTLAAENAAQPYTLAYYFE